MIEWTQTGLVLNLTGEVDWLTLRLWSGLGLSLVLAGVIFRRVWHKSSSKTGLNQTAPCCLAVRGIKNWLGVPKVNPVATAILMIVLLGFVVLFLLSMAASLRLLTLTVLGFDPQATFGLGALLVALLSAPFLIWRSVVAQKTLDVQLDTNITDRISKAVEQLGSENDAVRMGGVLALERLLRDAPQDKERIRVTLNAFLEYRWSTLKKGTNATIDMETALSVLVNDEEA